MELSIKQTAAIDVLEDNQINELIFGGGAGGGKSYLGCYWIVKNCVKYPGTRWVIGRHTLSTLKETTQKSLTQVLKAQGLKLNTHYSYNKNDKQYTFWNSSEIILKDLATYPADPDFDELGSLEITGAFVDECNQIAYKAWTVLSSRIRYKLEEYGLTPKILGTCNPSKNWVYKYFFNPERNESILPHRRFIQALLTDNPKVDKNYKRNLERMDDVALKERLLYGNWDYDDDPASLIPHDKILTMFVDRPSVRPGLKFITADIARLGRDKTVICLWSGLRCYRMITIPKSRVNETVEAIEKLRTSHNVPVRNIIVDEDGVGGGVKDYLNCNGFVNNSSPIPIQGVKEAFFNLKSQCYFKLADMIKNEMIYVNAAPEDQEALSEELSWVKQKDMDKDGKRRVMGKDEVKSNIGRSPDFSDAIMLRMFFELRKRADPIAV